MNIWNRRCDFKVLEKFYAWELAKPCLLRLKLIVIFVSNYLMEVYMNFQMSS